LNEPAISFTYNDLGQRHSMTDASGTTNYVYDVRNRLASKQTPNGNLNYTYDENGSIKTLRSNHANGVSVDYSYDDLSRLNQVKDNRLSGSQNTTYTYDAVGNLQSYTYPNTVITSYAYNNLNRLTTLSVANGQTNLASYAYTLGASGNRTSVTEASGRTVNYAYDDLYRLTSETIANSANNGQISYQFDAVGNRLQRNSNVNLVTNQNSSYDANDRITSDVFDNNGSTKISNGKTYNYDFENHLTSTSDGVTVVYDGDGNRVSKTVNGLTTKYLVDTNNLTGYAQVVEELQNGGVTKQYTYGLDLISQRQSSGVSFYNYDGHRSVRGLSNNLGSVTDTYTYDAFGTLIEKTGNTDNNYLYAGEQFDSDLGFYYNRARYLNVETGRFISQDTFEGNHLEPKSLHKYLYVGNDPSNKIDPSGYAELTLTGSLIAVNVDSILNAINGVLAVAAVVAVTCAIEAGVTATTDIEPLTPCGVRKPKDYVRFVHGTSMVSAITIDTLGVDFDSIINSGTGSWYPGAFFTFLLEPNPILAMSLAYDFAARRPSSRPLALMVGKMPRDKFNQLKSSGAIQTSALNGAGYDETVFFPQSFPTLNYYNRGKWEIIPK
jgi:RHS repeat-associated protein